MQPLVLQYGRPAACDRRRMRRIEAERPADEAEVVRDIMSVFGSLLARASRGAGDSHALALVAALRP